MYTLTQYYMNKGIQEFQQQGIDAIHKELL